MKTNQGLKYIPLLALLAMASCSSKQSSEQPEIDEPKVLVKTAQLTSELIEQEVDFTGSVEPFKQNHISSVSPNRIDKIFVEVGDEVKKGQLLVQMDNTMFAQMKVQLENLEKDYDRLDTLSRIGSVPQQQVDQVRTQLDVMRKSFQSSTENTRLLSPIDGIITGRYYNDGEMYSMAPSLAGKPAIVSVMQIIPVKVLVNIPEIYFPRVKMGMASTVTLDIYPGKEFKGKVHLIHPTIEPLTRTFTIEIEIPNQQMLIRPGMFSRVTFRFGDIERVVIPDLAVQRQMGTNERFVYAVENGRAVRKTVLVGRRVNTSYEVLSGLKVGENVVVAGHARLLDGTEVEVIN